MERKFITLFYQVSAMLNDGKFSPFVRKSLQVATANTTMLLKNNVFLKVKKLETFLTIVWVRKEKYLTSSKKIDENSIMTNHDNLH